MSSLEEELEDAYARIDELEQATGVDESRKRADAAEARAAYLDEENQRLQRENERSRDAMDALTDRVSSLDRQLREDRAGREDVTEALARAKANCERLEEQLGRCVPLVQALAEVLCCCSCARLGAAASPPAPLF